MQGLLMAMTAIGAYTSGHVSTFVSDLTATTRAQLLQQFTTSLSTLYKDQVVCRWLAEHVSLLGKPAFRLAQHLCQHPDDMAYDLLEISRVCHLPGDLPAYVGLCKLLKPTDKLNWVLEHLNACKFV